MGNTKFNLLSYHKTSCIFLFQLTLVVLLNFLLISFSPKIVCFEDLLIRGFLLMNLCIEELEVFTI